MDGWLERTFASLQNRHFRILWIGSLFAFVAFFMSTVVQSVVAFDLTGANRSVGFVVFGQGVAMLVLGPFGGALADRLSKRLVIFLCQTLTTAVFFVLAVLIATDAIRVAFLASGAFLIGTSFSFLGPARQAWVAELVGERRRGNAIALNQVALNASRVVGPLIAGALLAVPFVGAAGAYFTMAGIYAMAVGTLVFLPPSRPRADNEGRNVLADIGVGLRYVHRNKRLRVLVLFFVLVMMSGFPYITVLPGLVENQHGRDADAISVLLGVSAAGGLTASVAMAAFADSPRALPIYSGMGLLFGAAVAATGLSPSFWVAAIAMFFVGIGTGGFQTLNGAIVLRETEPAYFGRVMSLTMLAFAGFGLMGLPIGFLADALGERVTLTLMGAAVCTVVVVVTSVLMRIGPTPSQVPAPGAEARGPAS